VIMVFQLFVSDRCSAVVAASSAGIAPLGRILPTLSRHGVAVVV
jgi:hypothetical protein